MFNDPAYQIVHDVERFIHYERDYGYDLKIENVSRDLDLAIFDAVPFIIPEPILYSGYFSILKSVDFPVAENYWLVMSKKMLDVLKGEGMYSYEEFNTTVIDSRVSKEHWYDSEGNLRNEIKLESFVTIQLTDHLDIFDYDKSTYTLGHDSAGTPYIDKVTEYVFNIPTTGLPPLFHVKDLPITLFISNQARAALKNAGITGVKYYSLEGMRGGTAVDIPTPIFTDD
jgi:hypothetical protein